jgi:L-2-hydroxycarboxylate dehydrogenase (NAD+)
MDKWIERFRSAQAIAGEKVQIHGDAERISTTERKQNGIPLNEKVVEGLQELGERFKVKFKG